MGKKIYTIVVFVFLGVIFQISCKKENCEPNFNAALKYGTYTDTRDGTKYRTISFKGQVWMAENLRYFDKNAKSYDCNVYGQLYTEYTVKTACPPGWHLPSEEDWRELAENLSGEKFAGGSLKETGYDHWQSPNTGATNLIGFTALPAGGYDSNSGGFNRGVSAYFWTSTEIEHNGVIIIQLQNNSDNIAFIEDYPLDRAYSIRCIRDE